jgi:hypothetical protein
LEAQRIDLSAPWFDAIRAHVPALLCNGVLPADVASALNGSAHATRRFVQQSALPEGEAYEAFIARTQQVPTRNNWHDCFNGLMWHAMPRSKAALNALQAAQIAVSGVQTTRGAARDGATLFDESGAVLVTQDEALVQCWQQHYWQRLFVQQRSAWQQLRVWLFGHAVMEKLMMPYKAITAHTVWCPLPHTSTLGEVDGWLAAHLPAITQHKRWTPLPLLGVPGWWAANESPAFYGDAQVFRPLRAAAAKQR